MNSKVLWIGASLEFVYLIYLGMSSLPKLIITPMFLELSKHFLFQVVVLVIVLAGAFLNGKKQKTKNDKDKKTNKEVK